MFDHLNEFLGRLRIGSDDERKLFFASRLKAERIEEFCKADQYKYRQRVYTPAITLWMFLCQAIGDDHSCRKAVARNFVGVSPCFRYFGERGASQLWNVSNLNRRACVVDMQVWIFHA